MGNTTKARRSVRWFPAAWDSSLHARRPLTRRYYHLNPLAPNRYQSLLLRTCSTPCAFPFRRLLQRAVSCFRSVCMVLSNPTKGGILGLTPPAPDQMSGMRTDCMREG